MPETVVKLCECGCGQPAPIAKKTVSQYGHKKGEPKQFINGHNRRIPHIDGQKRCAKCLEYKDLSDYCKNRTTSDGLSIYCSPCRSQAKSKRFRLISKDEHDKMFADQGGCCAICFDPPNEHCLGVDHNHVTGKVRGLLCRTCNAGLGMFKDNRDLLESAIAYLEQTDG